MRELETIYDRPFLMDLPQLAQLATDLENYRAGHFNAAHAATPRGMALAGSVAIIPMVGPIFHRGGAFDEFFGLKSLQGFRAQLRQALASAEVSAVVIDWDSPGGEVDGTPEMAAELFEARGVKPIISIANTRMSSAAYWIGSQADEVIASPSAVMGSIGVWMLHQDHSEAFGNIGIKNTFIFSGDRKVDGNPFEPLSEEAEAALTAEVGTIHTQFIAAVSKARGVSASKGRKLFGDGRTMMASEALEVGLADGIGTLDQLVTKLSSGKMRRRKADEPRLAMVEDRNTHHVVADGTLDGENQYCERCGYVFNGLQFETGDIVTTTPEGVEMLSYEADHTPNEPTCELVQSTGDIDDVDTARRRDQDMTELAEALGL